ncbi:MAG: MFS transporter [Pseudomonadota bacterium]
MPFFHCALLFTLSVSQFLPLAFCVMALPTILLVQGVPLEQLSLIYLVGVVWVIKFLWAPYIDRISFGRFGHYKPWLLISQTLLVGTTILFILVGDVTNFHLMLVLATIMSVFASMQDIAVDAVACRLIPENQRGLGSAIQFSGNLVSTILGGGVVLVLYEHIGWQSCLWVITAAVAAVIVIIMWFDERDIELAKDIEVNRPSFSRLFSFWVQPQMGIWAVLLILLPMSITIVWSLASPILINRDWAPGEIGILLHIVAPIIGVVVTFGFGYLLNNFDKWLVIASVPILQAVAIFSLYHFIDLQLSMYGIMIALLLVYCLDIGLFVILNAFKLEYSGAGTEGTDFTVQNSLHGLAAFSAAAAALYFAEKIGFSNLILIAICLSIFSGLFLYGTIIFKPANTKKQSSNLGT